MTEPLSKQDLSALVDQLILEQGRLDPLELLMACDYLTYVDYESWRLGRVPHLEAVLRVPADQAALALAQAGRYAAAQRLAAEPLEHRAWGAVERIIPIGPERSPHPGLVRGCASAFVPPANRLQLDLFHDSQDLILEEAVRAALTGRRIDAAHSALTRLMALDPCHPRLRRYLHLIRAKACFTPSHPVLFSTYKRLFHQQTGVNIRLALWFRVLPVFAPGGGPNGGTKPANLHRHPGTPIRPPPWPGPALAGKSEPWFRFETSGPPRGPDPPSPCQEPRHGYRPAYPW